MGGASNFVCLLGIYVDCSDLYREKAITDFLRKTYGSYDYAYTLMIENDHHVDFNNLHPDIEKMLNTFERYSFSPIEKHQNEDTQDIER